MTDSGCIYAKTFGGVRLIREYTWHLTDKTVSLLGTLLHGIEHRV